MMDWTTPEFVAAERMRRRAYEYDLVRSVPSAPRAPAGGVRRAFAATFVRLGLRLDPAAGECLAGDGALTLARPEGRRS
jgi:hypothetical protein